MPTFSAHRCFGLKPIFALFLIAASLLSSCQRSVNREIENLVQEWTGKEITFPDNCKFSYQGVDECASPRQEARFKIVYYVDSVGCMSCKLRLEEWKKFIHKVDSVSSGNVSSFFYFHPKKKDMRELRFLLKSRTFDYPVCIDDEDRFNSANQFPENDVFHVFLLDEQNRVMVIGNPILNPAIRDLYLQVITGKGKDAEEPEPTDVSLSEGELELGMLELGVPVMRSVHITNVGIKPLFIQDVITSCDCVKAKAVVDSILPGESTDIHIEYTPDESGEFFKDVYIYCNTVDSPLSVQIHGYVK